MAVAGEDAGLDIRRGCFHKEDLQQRLDMAQAQRMRSSEYMHCSRFASSVQDIHCSCSLGSAEESMAVAA